MNEYFAREAANAEQINIELQAIAEALPGNWIVEQAMQHEDEWQRANDTLKDDQGRGLFILPVWNKKDRFDIMGCGWPEYVDENGQPCELSPSQLWNPKEATPETTAARSRGAKAIAAQIVRKVLPEYDRIKARLVEQAASYQSRSDKTASNRRALAEACQDEYREGNTHFYVRDIPGDTVRIEAYSSSHARLCLPVSEVVQVVALLRELRGQS